jgi:hypothetical protein
MINTSLNRPINERSEPGADEGQGEDKTSPLGSTTYSERVATSSDFSLEPPVCTS